MLFSIAFGDSETKWIMIMYKSELVSITFESIDFGGRFWVLGDAKNMMNNEYQVQQ